jgi:carboxylesterase type B
MKRKLIKFFKIVTGTIIGLAVLFFAGLYWPLSDLKSPVKHEAILIKSITIIDVVSGKLIQNQDIKITGNKISEIGLSVAIKNTDDTFVIDGKGKFAIPGLWDMHTHSNAHSRWLHHPLYIANGVTNVRDMSGTLDKEDAYWIGSKKRRQWNKELDNNMRVTPRYVLQSSYQIDGEKSVPTAAPDFFKLNSVEDVTLLLDFYKNEKVDFIKIYQQIKPESYRELAKQVSNYNMHLAGHKPIFVTLEEAIKSGQRSFEHGRIFMYDCFPKADSLRLSQNWRENYGLYKNEMIAQFDDAKAESLMSLMRDKKAYWTPTLQTLKFEANAHKDEFLNNPMTKYISATREKLWWSFDISGNKERNLEDPNNIMSEKLYEKSKSLVRKANSIGVPIMVGTDVTDSYTFAGFSVHEELIDLVAAGLSNIEALRAATIIPAEYTNKQNELGSIEHGKIADLVILDKNPLTTISNSKRIYGVIQNGVYYDKEKIDELKKFTETIASSYHMNIKVFYSFINSPLMRVQFAD